MIYLKWKLFTKNFHLFVLLVTFFRHINNTAGVSTALMKSDHYCISAAHLPHSRRKIVTAVDKLMNKSKSVDFRNEIQLACPRLESIVNVFELRFMINANCSLTASSGYTNLLPHESTKNVLYLPKHINPSRQCQAKSIRGNNLLECEGNICSLSQIGAIKVCGLDANQIYALYECIPVVLERSIVWSRLNSTIVNDSPTLSDISTSRTTTITGKSQPHLITNDQTREYDSRKITPFRQLTCPNDTTIVVTRATALAGSLDRQSPLTCSSHESFTIQTTRMCFPACHTCNVSMNSPGSLRCKHNKKLKNEYSIINYSCIPRIDHFDAVNRRYSFCETATIESNTLTNGFIVSPDYPDPYPPNVHCNLTLISNEYPITLYLLSFDVVYPHSMIVHSKVDASETAYQKIHLHAKDKMPRMLAANASQINLDFNTNYIAGKGHVILYFTNVPSWRQHETVHKTRKDVNYESKPKEYEPKIDYMTAKLSLGNLLFERQGMIYVPRPVLIYILASATFLLIISLVALLIGIFICPSRKSLKRMNMQAKLISEPTASQESHQKLLLDYYGTYEELGSQKHFYSRADSLVSPANYHQPNSWLNASATHCIHCCPLCHTLTHNRFPAASQYSNRAILTSAADKPIHCWYNDANEDDVIMNAEPSSNHQLNDSNGQQPTTTTNTQHQLLANEHVVVINNDQKRNDNGDLLMRL